MITNYIVKPVVTEKSVANGQANKYTFVVRQDATKIGIAQQLTALFGVAPVKVNILKRPSKVRTLGRREIEKRKEHKRAIVTFPAEASIDIFKPKAPKSKK